MVTGKLPPRYLIKYVYSRLGARDDSVIAGPGIGEDAAAIDLGNGKVLVIHSDAISGAIKYIGWLAVHIASNDIAVSGAKPRWLLPTIYLPEDSNEGVIDTITSQMDRAAKEVGAAIVGGHTEFTPGINRPLISMTAIGITERNKYIKTGNAKPGDAVIITKAIALEGTAILAADFRDILLERGITLNVIEKSLEFIRMVSVVSEALKLAEAGLPTSMHDPTEGGVIGGLSEVAYASGVTIEVWEGRIPILSETKAICNALNIDPLRLISSGALIATIPSNYANYAISILRREGIDATVVGKVLPRTRNNLVILHRINGKVEYIEDVYVQDELFRLWHEERK